MGRAAYLIASIQIKTGLMIVRLIPEYCPRVWGSVFLVVRPAAAGLLIVIGGFGEWKVCVGWYCQRARERSEGTITAHPASQ